jgi:hypothetical protein
VQRANFTDGTAALQYISELESELGLVRNQGCVNHSTERPRAGKARWTCKLVDGKRHPRERKDLQLSVTVALIGWYLLNDYCTGMNRNRHE